MCLKAVSLFTISALFLCLPRFFFLSFSNQKAKPCRQLRANNKSLPVDVWRWWRDRSSEGENTLWSFPVLKPAEYYTFLHKRHLIMYLFVACLLCRFIDRFIDIMLKFRNLRKKNIWNAKLYGNNPLKIRFFFFFFLSIIHYWGEKYHKIWFPYRDV